MRGPLRQAGVVTLKHLQIVRRGDRVWTYLRAPGKPRVRLPDLPHDDPQFLAAYLAALAGAPARRDPAGSIAAACTAYLASPRFGALRPSYRLLIRREVDAIRDQAEDAQLRHLKTRHIRDDLRPLAPHAASKRLKAWRAICRHAIEAGDLQDDPSHGIRTPQAASSDGHEPWTAQDVAAFRARWPIGTRERAAMELLHWTGARRSDVVTLGRGMIDRDGVLRFRQGKTADWAYVPWTCPLPDYAAHMEADRRLAVEAVEATGDRHMTWICQGRGGPRSVKAFGGFFGDACRAAGLTKSAHGLRKTRAIALAESGGTPHQIGAWTGHATLSEIERYTRKADRRRAVMGAEQDRNSVNAADGSVN